LKLCRRRGTLSRRRRAKNAETLGRSSSAAALQGSPAATNSRGLFPRPTIEPQGKREKNQGTTSRTQRNPMSTPLSSGPSLSRTAARRSLGPTTNRPRVRPAPLPSKAPEDRRSDFSRSISHRTDRSPTPRRSLACHTTQIRLAAFGQHHEAAPRCSPCTTRSHPQHHSAPPRCRLAPHTPTLLPWAAAPRPTRNKPAPSASFP